MVMAAVDTVFAARRAATQDRSATPRSESRVIAVHTGFQPRGVIGHGAPAIIYNCPYVFTRNYFEGSPQVSDNEVISETEDETQGPLLHMPNLKPSADELLGELERYVAVIKKSRAKDLEDCECVESILLRYKVTRSEEMQKAATTLNGQLTKAEASLDSAREMIHAVISIA